MVSMVVAEDDVFNPVEADAEFTGIDDESVGAGAGVEQDAAAIGFYECGEAPFADAAAVSKHSGEHSNAERLYATRRRRLSAKADSGGTESEPLAPVETSHGFECIARHLLAFEDEVATAWVEVQFRCGIFGGPEPEGEQRVVAAEGPFAYAR